MQYFVTENWLKTNGVITANVDATDFSPLVQFAAKAFIKKQIGSYFFEDLLTKYNAQTLSLVEQSVVEKMQWGRVSGDAWCRAALCCCALLAAGRGASLRSRRLLASCAIWCEPRIPTG